MDLLQPADLIPDRALTEGERDAFNHEAMAGRIAEIAVHSPTPTNIAIFGAWGSGKSSLFELLRRELVGRGTPKVALIRYDAWKYGGASLKRNFISHTANDLGLKEGDYKNRAFHRGLYESTRSVDLRFEEFLRAEAGQIIMAAVGAALVAAISVIGLAALVGWLTERGIEETVRVWGGAWAPTVGGVFGTIVGALRLLDVARVEVEHSAPSTDEQFSRTFAKVVAAGRRRGRFGRYDRLVFFVDELDRCSKADVVETLTALRTFLDIPRCVFIVVADRDVLEEALVALPQSTPANEDSPYYSSASSFLDKVFQFQLSLPPLRFGRLTRFARDLVSGRQGLWERLATAGEDTLNEVVYALIPSHVRSPRRVKVLLNRFVTNARVAEARGIDWLARAPEIAKLSALQTEWPLFADALVMEPRLPLYVLGREEPPTYPTRGSAAIRRFIRLGDGPDSDRVSDASLDRVISKNGVGAIQRTQRQQLVRYLERSSPVPNPGRDLLYLEAGGVAMGLDAEAGRVLEDLAADAPEKALSFSEGLSVAQQEVALAFLADMSEREFGVEQANVVATMLALASAQREPRRDVFRPVAAALQTFRQQQDLPPERLVDALKVSVVAAAEDLRTALMRDERLLASRDRVLAVAEELPHLSSDDRAILRTRIAELLPEDPDVFLRSVAANPVQEGEWLFENLEEDVVAHARQLEAGSGLEEAESFLRDVLTASKSFEPVVKVLWRLLRRGHKAAYAVLRDSLPRLRDLSPRRRNSHALLALLRAPPEDWSLWTKILGADKPWEPQGRRAIRTLRKMLDQLADVDEASAEHAQEIASHAAALTRIVDSSASEVLGSQVSDALAERDWWANEQLCRVQQRFHDFAARLGSGGEKLRIATEEARVADLIRSLTNFPNISPLSLSGMVSLSADLSPSGVEKVLAELESQRVAPDSPLAGEWHRTRILLRGEVEGTDPERLQGIEPEDVVSAMGDYSEAGWRAFESWLRGSPPPDAVVRVCSEVPAKSSRRAAGCVAEWVGALTDQARTTLLRHLWSEGKTGSEWIRSVRAFGVDELALVDDLVKEAENASRAETREEVIDRILALAPQEGRSQHRVGDLVVWLLNTGLKVDFNLAFRLAPALGSGHRSKGRIEEAIRKGVDSLKMTIAAPQVQALESVGIRAPKRSLTERALSFLTRK